MTKGFGVLAVLVVLLTGTLPAQQTVPTFLVVTTSGTSHTYSTATVNDAVITATVTDAGGGRWTLNISQVKQALREVYFPWSPQRTPLDSDLSNDLYYYPYLLGRTEKAPNHNADWTWWGLPYPGSATAPLVVMADPASAKIVAATNWPSKPVTPLYAAQRLVLRYDAVMPVGSAGSFGVLIATVTGNAATGDVPWQKALDLYRAWLETARGPITYPSWMLAGQGMIDIQLEAYANLAGFESFWHANKTRYPWLLMWGQNSPQGGSCCGIDPATSKYYPTLPQFHARWVPSLVDWAKAQTAAGYRVGYYSAPYDGQYGDGTDRLLDTPAGIDWFTKWNSANQAGGGNSYYFDVLARRPWGDPAAVLNLFTAGTISTDAMSEGIVDTYPLPGLASGSLAGGTLCGAPHRTPETATITTFPPFVRYLLNDRLIFWGWENDDFQFHGVRPHSGCDYVAYCVSGICDYGVERVLFLTGARISFAPGFANAVVDAIVAERERVNWWPRRPRYLSTKGLNLTTIPASSRVEVAHFQDSTGASLVAISNPTLAKGLSFTVNGTAVPVPATAIAIVEPTASTPPPTDDVAKQIAALQAQDVAHSAAIAALQATDATTASTIATLEKRVAALETATPPTNPVFSITVAPLSRPIGKGATVTVTWTYIPTPTANDWIAIYVASAPNQPANFTNNDERWKYVNCLRGTSGTVAVPSGGCAFDVSGLAAGVYNARLFANDSFTEIGRTVNFTLTP